MDEKADRKLTTRDIAGVAREDRPVEPRPPQDGSNQTRRAAGQPVADEVAAPLFDRDEAQGYRTRWDGVQTGFVDEPRKAVEEADALVADVMKRLADGFSREREALEKQWDRGDKISTEDLRLALRRYRSFFQRLLSV
jgi:hypothetical protein